MAKYLDPKNDVVFKKIFGEETREVSPELASNSEIYEAIEICEEAAYTEEEIKRLNGEK
ncbi:MAG: hypothetical protein LBC48_01370 [Dysgonamonadaceae bacterium]|jgi:hypothetical protein|nr:hypothetical protein [Dysgonamonadaceae bacterium]